MRVVAATGALLLIVSASLAWIEAPITGQVSTPLFGWSALAIGIIAGAAWITRTPVLTTVAGVLGLALCGLCILRFVLMESAFWSLIDENAQYANIVKFSARHLPPNLGVEPNFQPTFPTESLGDRLAASVYFMSFGWWIAFVGSLLVIFGGLWEGKRVALRWALGAAGILIATQMVILSPGLLAEYAREQGDWLVAQGLASEAIEQYETAQRWGPQLAKSAQIQLRLGALHHGLGLRDNPNVRFYLGDRYFREKNFEAAFSEFELVIQDAPTPLEAIVRQRLASSVTLVGLRHYRKGRIGSAAAMWEKALATDESQLQAAYFLTRAYFDQGQFEASLTMCRLVLSKSRNRIVNANVQANMGDGYWALGQYTRAREAYVTSMRLDKHANYRIFKSLGGT